MKYHPISARSLSRKDLPYLKNNGRSARVNILLITSWWKDITNTYALWKKPGSGKGCTFDGPVLEENHLSVIKTCFTLCSLSPGVLWEWSQRKACLSLCSLSPGVPWEGSQGKACLSLCSLSLCSLSPGVPWEGSQLKACLSLCSLSSAVSWEGSQWKACLSLCSLSPGVLFRRVPGKGLSVGLFVSV